MDTALRVNVRAQSPVMTSFYRAGHAGWDKVMEDLIQKDAMEFGVLFLVHCPHTEHENAL